MKKTPVALLLFLMSLPTTLQAQEVSAEPPNDTVTVTVTIDGAGQYSDQMAETVQQLEAVLTRLEGLSIDLPDEDMAALGALVVSSTDLIQELSTGSEQLAAALALAERPVLDLSQRVIDRANARLVEPTVDSLRSTLWLFLGLSLVTVLATVLALALILRPLMLSLQGFRHLGRRSCRRAPLHVGSVGRNLR